MGTVLYSVLIVVGVVIAICFAYAAGFYGCLSLIHGAFSNHYKRLIALGFPTREEIDKSVVEMSEEIRATTPARTFLTLFGKGHR